MSANLFRGIFIGMCTQLICFSAQAALEGRLPVTPGGVDYQAYYDTDRDLTWLADANLAASNTFGVGGILSSGEMDWATANLWIAAMNADGGSGYLGYNDWRLPETITPDPNCSFFDAFGSGCVLSEMGHLNNVEGIFWSSPQAAGNPFTNLQFNSYWSATENALNPGQAWVYGFDLGGQDVFNKTATGGVNAWAVRSGDVSIVPLPASLVLATSGWCLLLGGRLFGNRRR